MNFYQQSIILFGIVIPVLIAAAVVGGGYYMKNQMADSYENKKAQYKTHNQARSEVATLEQDVSGLRPHLKRWDEQLSKEIASEVGTRLREITSKLPDKEIQQTAFNPSSQGSGFAGGNPSAKVSIGFRGTFRALQQTFLELEASMPQLQVEDLRIDPVATSGYLLNLQIDYTAWQK